MTFLSNLVSGKSPEERPIDIRIQMQIPAKYRQEPIIYNLSSFYDLKVNIIAAMLSKSSQESGWFDIEIHGSSRKIEEAIFYLKENGVIIWLDSRREYDGW